MRVGPIKPVQLVRIFSVVIVITSIASLVSPWWTVSRRYHGEDYFGETDVSFQSDFSHLWIEEQTDGHVSGWMSEGDYHDEKSVIEYESITVDKKGLNQTSVVMSNGRIINGCIIAVGLILLGLTYTKLDQKLMLFASILILALVISILLNFIIGLDHAQDNDEFLIENDVDGLFGDSRSDSENSWYPNVGFYLSMTTLIVSIFQFYFINRHYEDIQSIPIPMSKALVLFFLCSSIMLLFFSFYAPIWSVEERTETEEYGLVEERISWYYDSMYYSASIENSNLLGGRDLKSRDSIDDELDVGPVSTYHKNERSCLEVTKILVLSAIILNTLTLIVIVNSRQIRMKSFVLPLMILTVGIATAAPVFFMISYPDAMESDMGEHNQGSSIEAEGSEFTKIQGFAGSAEAPGSDTVGNTRYEWGPDSGWISIVYSAIFSWLALAVYIKPDPLKVTTFLFIFAVILASQSASGSSLPEISDGEVILGTHPERANEYHYLAVKNGSFVTYQSAYRVQEETGRISIIDQDGYEEIIRVNASEWDWDGRYLYLVDRWDSSSRYNGDLWIYDRAVPLTNITSLTREKINISTTRNLTFNTVKGEYPYVLFNPISSNRSDITYHGLHVYDIISNQCWEFPRKVNRFEIIGTKVLQFQYSDFESKPLEFNITDIHTNVTTEVYTSIKPVTGYTRPDFVGNENIVVWMERYDSGQDRYVVKIYDLQNSTVRNLSSFNHWIDISDISIYDGQVFIIYHDPSESYRLMIYNISTEETINVPFRTHSPPSTLSLVYIGRFDIYQGSLYVYLTLNWIRPAHYFLGIAVIDYAESFQDISFMIMLDLSFDTDNDGTIDIYDDDIDGDGSANDDDINPYHFDSMTDGRSYSTTPLLSMLIVPYILFAIISFILILKGKLHFSLD